LISSRKKHQELENSHKEEIDVLKGEMEHRVMNAQSHSQQIQSKMDQLKVF